jgi:hypothetical protein
MEVRLFYGSIPSHVQKIVMEHVRGWTCKAVYVGCSGNFTIERLLAGLNRFDLHSNDITIYSSAVGAYFAGSPLRLALAMDAQSEFGWLEEYLRTPSHALATVMLATALIPLISAEGTIKQGAYHQRVYAGLRKQWDTLHQKTREKIEGTPLRLASFACRDVAEWIDDVPEDAGFILCPPFFSTDKAFQRDIGKLDRLFDWDRPTFQQLTDEQVAAVLRKATARCNWIFALSHALPEYADRLRGVTQITSRGETTHVYSSQAPTRIVSHRHVSLELKRLDTALNAIFEDVQNGKLEAVDRLLKIMERRAKYLGLDAPTRFSAKFDDLRRVTEEAGIDIAALIKAMMAEIQNASATIG